VVPIDDPERIRRITVEALLVSHVCNAFERGTELVLDVVAASDHDGVDGWHRGLPSGRGGSPLATSLRRVTVDLRSGRARGETLLSRSCEMPVIAPSVCGEAYRFAYLVGHSSARAASGLPDRLLKVEVETGRVAELELGPDQYPSEPVFVPRSNAAAEDDGWLVTQVYDARSHRSHAAVIDAARFDAPTARAHLGHHLPYPMHGTWLPTEDDPG
jgi:all-trans-8'-apo-beta-carotenal 15,15'-oxygenase